MPESFHAGLLKRAESARATERVARRHKWRGEIARRELADVAATFKNDGFAAPEIVWAPGDRDCATSINNFLIAHWFQLVPTGGIPPATSIDPSFFKNALGYVHLLETLEAGEDFRYRVFGSLISSVLGFDMTGHSMSAFDASDCIVDLAIAAVAASIDLRQPLLTRRASDGVAQISVWERLILPFADETGQICRLLVGTVPLKVNGEVIRPRF